MTLVSVNGRGVLVSGYDMLISANIVRNLFVICSNYSLFANDTSVSARDPDMDRISLS